MSIEYYLCVCTPIPQYFYIRTSENLVNVGSSQHKLPRHLKCQLLAWPDHWTQGKKLQLTFYSTSFQSCSITSPSSSFLKIPCRSASWPRQSPRRCHGDSGGILAVLVPRESNVSRNRRRNWLAKKFKTRQSSKSFLRTSYWHYLPPSRLVVASKVHSAVVSFAHSSRLYGSQHSKVLPSTIQWSDSLRLILHRDRQPCITMHGQRPALPHKVRLLLV